MSSWRQQALIEAPIEAVWALVGDPAKYPEWAPEVVGVTGVPTLARDATFELTSKMPVGLTTTTFRIEELEELHEIKMRCQTSGFYGHWLLTETQGSTFADVEIGIDPLAFRYRAIHAAMGGKRYFRRLVEAEIDGVRNLVERAAQRSR